MDFKEKDRFSNGVNYDVWVIRMFGFLKEVGLWGVVSGDELRLYERIFNFTVGGIFSLSTVSV